MHDGASHDDRSAPAALEMLTKREGRTATVEMRGELDAYTAPGLEELCGTILDEGADAVVLDLAGITFLDSSGLRALVSLHQRIEDARGELTIDRPTSNVVRLLEITGLRDHFVIERLPEGSD